MKPFIQNVLDLLHDRDPRLLGGLIAVVLLAAAGMWLFILSRRPTA